LKNCEAILNAGGATLADVVEVGILLADPDDFAGMNEAYATVFDEAAPTRYAAKRGAVIPVCWSPFE
jgi:2-iminobutanoate/2-iminopropanoate deaminase